MNYMKTCSACGENYFSAHYCKAREKPATWPFPKSSPTPLKQLTESDVRRIVREELARKETK